MREQRNREISTYNTVGVVSVSVAGAALGTWLFFSLKDQYRPAVSLGFDTHGATLVLGGAWP